MDSEEFKEALIKRSKEITTCFFIDECTEPQFEQMFDDFKQGKTIDEIIEKAFDDCYEGELE